jgi:hypothetical protein
MNDGLTSMCLNFINIDLNCINGMPKSSSTFELWKQVSENGLLL